MSDDDDNEQESFGFLLHDAARAITAAFGARLKPLELTRSQWRAILYAARTPGILQAQLADILGVGPMSVTSTVDKLESKGYLRRSPDPTDRRAKRICLTPAAEALIPTMRETGRQLNDELFRDIDADRRRLATEVLRQIVDNCEAVIREADACERPEAD